MLLNMFVFSRRRGIVRGHIHAVYVFECINKHGPVGTGYTSDFVLVLCLNCVCSCRQNVHSNEYRLTGPRPSGVSQTELTNLIEQLPSHCVLVGDYKMEWPFSPLGL